MIEPMNAETRRGVTLARHDELGAFLRSRRARLTPEEVSLPPGSRRRTPGLRREEVAQLAGVGVTWYTWFEQGREIRVSRHVLASVARALRLDGAERAHLQTLAGLDEEPPPTEFDHIPQAVQALIDALEPAPALVVNNRYDVLAWNRAESALVGDFGRHPLCDRNLLLQLFIDATWRHLLVDWSANAAWMVAQFRANMAKHVGEKHWVTLERRLVEASREFADMWERHDVARAASCTKRYLHPLVGMVTTESVTMRLADAPDCRVIAYMPADEASRTALERLVGGKGAAGERGASDARPLAAAAGR
jgi:transcriptional regulator with XRE-family HTH domain